MLRDDNIAAADTDEGGHNISPVRKKCSVVYGNQSSSLKPQIRRDIS